jgi:hypothetical protein
MRFRAAGWALTGSLILLAGTAGAEPSSPSSTPLRRDVAPGSAAARAARLTSAERRALLGGHTVTRPIRFEQGSGRYVGGVAYQVVPATPQEVLATLLTVPELHRILPRTKQARLVDVQARGARVELVQGNSVVEATYTVRLEHEPTLGVVRFWMDRSRPHDIEDVWGYFRVQRLSQGHTLLTVAVALDVGDGLVRWLFEDAVQRVILSAPRQIRDYLEPRVLAAAG